jgi:hypothetical protein
MPIRTRGHAEDGYVVATWFTDRRVREHPLTLAEAIPFLPRRQDDHVLQATRPH